MINIDNIKSDVAKPEMEMVEQQKQEYKLIGRILRTPGLSLYSYNPSEDKITKVDISLKNTAVLNADLEAESQASEEATIDPRHEHFEALNDKSAHIRVEKFKSGKINQLDNLRMPVKNPLKL